jgi:hypothetical protein
MNSKRDRPGQPTKLTPEIIQQVAELLPTLLYLESVGDCLGVSRITWRGWVKRGAKESARLAKPGARPRARETLYVEFFYSYKKALAQAEADSLERVRQAGVTQWQAAAWLLERRNPQRWAANRRELQRLAAQVSELMRLYGCPPGRAGLPAAVPLAPPLVPPLRVGPANGPAPPAAVPPPAPDKSAAPPWLVSSGRDADTPPPADAPSSSPPAGGWSWDAGTS